MNLPPVIRQRYLDANAKPLAGGKLYTYQAGTTTPQATYTDSSGSTPNANPIVLDANGEARMWLDPSLSYKFILKDSNDVQQWTEDNVIGLLTANAVVTASIADGAVTTPKLAANAVDSTKLASDAAIDANRAVNTNHIRNSAVNLAKLAADALASIIPTGASIMWDGNPAVDPSGFLVRDGRAVSRATYATLFGVIGTKFGQGDNSTTFNLPDDRWLVPRGYGPNITVACGGSASSNNVTATAHAFNRSGVRCRVTGTPVTGLSLATDYFVIWVDANTIAFATTRANANAGTKIVISGSAAAMTVIQWEDPDAATRDAPAPGGNSGANLGSIQDDQIASHTHNVLIRSGTTTANQPPDGGTSGGFNYPTSATGGNETRAKNAYRVWMIKT